MLLLVAAVMGCQVVVHLPLLYNPRYSEGSFELWLAVLGGCGAAVVSAWPRRRFAFLALALALACYAGKTIRHLEGPVAPLRFSPDVSHRIAWQMPTPEKASPDSTAMLAPRYAWIASPSRRRHTARGMAATPRACQRRRCPSMGRG